MQYVAHHFAGAIALAFETTLALVKIPSRCWYVASSSSVLATRSVTFLKSASSSESVGAVGAELGLSTYFRKFF